MEQLGFMLSQGILEKGKNTSVFKNTFLYLAFVKPAVNKDQFDFV